MKQIATKLAACVCGLLVFCIASSTHAAGLTGTWKGLCDNRDMTLTLSQTDLQVSGTLELGRETFTVEGTTDNSSDNGTLTLEGTGGNGIVPRSCTGNFSITASGQMSGTLAVRSRLGLRVFSGEALLQHLEQVVDFSLIIGHVQAPSNIYLFFSLQDGAGKPVTGLTQEDFEIYEDDLLKSDFESKRAIIPNPSVYTMATVLLLDMSGSITESQALAPLKNSAKAFLEKVAGEEGQEVAIYYFDGRENIVQLSAFNKNITALKATIDSLNENTTKDLSTNLNGAVQQGLTVLDERRGAIEAGELFTGSLVTFTDGTDQAGYVSNEAALASVAASTHYSFTIGLGGEIDETHLKNLGKSGFAFADDAEGLDAAFDEIAGTIRSESGKRYVLGYCTPKRAGDHKVTIRVKNRSGALSYAFNADEFTGSYCDPNVVPEGMEPGDSGQCLFQIQPDAVRKHLILPRRVALTIESDQVELTQNATVAIDGLNVVSTRYRKGKLRVIAKIPLLAKKQAYTITVNTGEEKITCFNALTVK